MTTSFSSPQASRRTARRLTGGALMLLGLLTGWGTWSLTHPVAQTVDVSPTRPARFTATPVEQVAFEHALHAAFDDHDEPRVTTADYQIPADQPRPTIELLGGTIPADSAVIQASSTDDGGVWLRGVVAE